MTNQKGITLFGMALVAIVIVFAAVLVMKLVPPYIDYWAVKKVLTVMGNDPDLKGKSVQDVRNSFSKRAGIDNITSIKSGDLEITKDGGEVLVEAKYRVEVPIVANITACLDFFASSKPGAEAPAKP